MVKYIRKSVFYLVIFLSLLGLLNYFNVSYRVDAGEVTTAILEEHGPVMLTGGEFRELPDGSRVYELNLVLEQTSYLYLPRNNTVRINHEIPEILGTYRGQLYRIEGQKDNSHFSIEILPAYQDFSAVELCPYLGSYEAVSRFDLISSACNFFLEGFCCAIVVFSLVLMVYKPTEKYLRWLALLAFFTGSYYRLRALFGMLGLTILLDSNMYQVVNQLVMATLQFMVMKEFVSIQWKKNPLFWICIAGGIPAMVLYQNGNVFPFANIFFYAVLYLVYFICFLTMDNTRAMEQRVLLSAWAITTSMRFLELFCEAGLLQSGTLNLLVRLRGLVSVVYIAAFFLIICKRFAEKFQESDQLNLRLEKEVEIKSRENLVFVRSMLHNLKTPLFSLSGYSDMAEEAIDSDPEASRMYIRKIRDKSIFISQLMDQISLATRMNTGLLQLQKVPVSLAGIAAQCIDTAKNALDQKQIEITADIDGDAYTMADAIYLTQAVQNVLDNAVVHTDEKGEIHLQTEKSPDGQSWCLHIRDNGCGIDADEKEKIFDAYYSNRHGKSASTGLGLYITKEIVRLHSGEIYVDSRVGEGSDFTLVLPYYDAEESEQNT